MSQTHAGRQAAIGLLLAVVAVVALIAGRQPLSILIAVLCVLAYGELRVILVPSGRLPTLVAGGVGVLAFLLLGYRGRLASLPCLAAALNL